MDGEGGGGAEYDVAGGGGGAVEVGWGKWKTRIEEGKIGTNRRIRMMVVG